MSRVLVIGAGPQNIMPSGIGQLAALKEMDKDNSLEIFYFAQLSVTCFEQNPEMGGLWTWSGEVGDNVHHSMYRYHQTNGLNEMLEIPDYSFVEHFGHAITSYPPRAVMLDYLQGWAKKWDLEKNIHCNTKVISVDFSENAFNVISENTKTGHRSHDVFDFVVVCTGHFSFPNHIEKYPGMEHYKGFAMHSHNFRDARDYAGKKLLVIGNGYSGEDIAMQCVKFGAKHCTVAYRSGPMGHDFEDMAISETQIPTHFDKDTKEFVTKCGSRLKDIDGVIYCTGYRHHFPFLSKDLNLSTPNRLVPDTLWKGILHPENSKLMFLGMPDQYYTFSAFHAQGKFVTGVIQGRVSVPSKEDMYADTKRWQDKEDNMGDDHKVHHRLQYEHTEEAAQLAGAHLRDDSGLFDQWLDDRHDSILRKSQYRDQSAVSAVSGVASLKFGMPWEIRVKMFTDDKVHYLEWCRAEYSNITNNQDGYEDIVAGKKSAGGAVDVGAKVAGAAEGNGHVAVGVN